MKAIKARKKGNKQRININNKIRVARRFDVSDIIIKVKITVNRVVNINIIDIC